MASLRKFAVENVMAYFIPLSLTKKKSNQVTLSSRHPWREPKALSQRIASCDSEHLLPALIEWPPATSRCPGSRSILSKPEKAELPLTITGKNEKNELLYVMIQYFGVCIKISHSHFFRLPDALELLQMSPALPEPTHFHFVLTSISFPAN
jgi:hypothetical protein